MAQTAAYTGSSQKGSRLGPEAVARAQQLNPDVILMDVGLPTLKGLEAARQIRGLFSSPVHPISGFTVLLNKCISLS